jgi:hypothetical protein
VDNIKRDHRKIEWDGTHRDGVSQDREQGRALVSTVMNFRLALNAGKLLSSCATGSFSGRAAWQLTTALLGRGNGEFLFGLC